MKTGVYMIRNRVNGKRYIGSAASSFRARWQRHKRDLVRGNHSNKYLQVAWDKYGADNLEFAVLVECPPEDCLRCEQAFLNVFSPEYNLAVVAGAAMANRSHTPEARAKISAASKEHWQAADIRERTVQGMQGTRVVTEEMKANLSKKLTGRKFSEETRLKMREAAKRRFQRPDQKEWVAENAKKASNARWGK